MSRFTYCQKIKKIKFSAPNSATLSRKSNGDTLSVHSSPGQTLKHGKGNKGQHQRTGSEPVIMGTPRLATVTVTKGNSRQMIPVSELPKFGEFVFHTKMRDPLYKEF